ncbi:hypothetical protein [Paenarthrobacter sp. Z7-10]|uniref:hypothetical protein n=1 Tax=Paenarthrobacter sp. Z7-10 TaxID=2787635 RepID=UPI0022A8F4BA|nr:hypothetical protein [Paenarthrobacter sp. Z7-10]
MSMDGEVRIRPAAANDAAILAAAAFEAMNWRGDGRLTREQLHSKPELSHYLDGWMRGGDFGVVAETEAGTGVGAAWCRTFTADDAG